MEWENSLCSIVSTSSRLEVLKYMFVVFSWHYQKMKYIVTIYVNVSFWEEEVAQK